MREALGLSAEKRIKENDHSIGVNLTDFIAMVDILSFAELNLRQRDRLLKLFKEHCDKDYRLRTDALCSLIRALGHNEDKVEIEMLMNVWDVKKRGYLDFGTLVSIVAHALKTVELKSKVQDDFLRLTGRHKHEILSSKHYLLNTVRPVIVAADLVRTGRNRGMPINHEIAEEMVFDANEIGEDSVGLDDLIATLEMTSLIESTQQNVRTQANKASGFRAINSEKVLATLKDNSETFGKFVTKDCAQNQDRGDVVDGELASMDG